MTATHCQNIVDALDLAEQLDEYILSPSIASPEDAAAEELAFILPEKAAKMIRPHINLHTYGQALLASRNNIQTEYGCWSARGWTVHSNHWATETGTAAGRMGLG